MLPAAPHGPLPRHPKAPAALRLANVFSSWHGLTCAYRRRLSPPTSAYGRSICHTSKWAPERAANYTVKDPEKN